MTAKTLPTTPFDFAELPLQRVPPDAQLQAWNAADELLLARLSDTSELSDILIVNDSFGALAAALHHCVGAWWSDSAMSRQALQTNLTNQGLALPELIDQPEQLPASLTTVVIVVPKSVALFDWQLGQIASRLSALGKVYALGMVKHLSDGHQKAMQRWFGDVQPGRAVKKARCIELTQPLEAQPVQPTRYQTPQGLKLICQPGCFSAQRPDPGALAFLEVFDQLPAVDRVLDLGCGNGILALSYLQQHAHSRAIAVDESAQAIASARASAQANDMVHRLEWLHHNGLDQRSLDPIPLMLCNPPFHQETSLTDAIAEQLIQDAVRTLSAEGELWLVGNRHLGYHHRLRRYFKNVSVQSSHPKFVVLRASGAKS